MKNAVKLLASGSVFAMALGSSAFAADLSEPVYVEPPVFQAPEQVPAGVSGWYIRGDVGYNTNKFGRSDLYYQT
ncbi:MAG: hypothetical protein U5K75_03770 [Ahrensia sp.]|nr:hypothetical protein [Ahrensia sp.]